MTSPVLADKARLYKVFIRKPRHVSLSDGTLRMASGREALLPAMAVEALEDVTIRRRWFSTSLTVRTVQGEVHTVTRLDKNQASRVADAVHEAAAARATAVEPGLVAVDETLHRLLRRERYVRYSEMLDVHNKLAPVVRHCHGLISRQLTTPGRDALQRLTALVPTEGIEAAREHANEAFVSNLVPAVVAAADAALGARISDEQAKAIATDEDVTLVLAGAGTGKTTVIAGKVTHLVNNEGVDPRQILVLVFNKKAQQEIVDRLSDELAADVQTFHAFGRRVVADCEGAPTVSKVATDDHVMRSVIDKILNDLIASEETSNLVTNFLIYHAEVCNSPFDFASDDEYNTYWRSVELRTLSGDLVKSIQELQIANFLTEHGVTFQYEASYEIRTATPERRQYLPDFYLPEHGIYIEHFALDENDNPPPHWTTYKQGVVWKRRTHRQYGTRLIETFSWEHKRGVWRSALRNKLEANGVVLSPVPRQELLRLLSEPRIRRLSGLLATFLDQVKTSNVDVDVLRSRARARGDVVRNLAFLEVFAETRRRYEQLLTDNHERDFHDFINRAAGHIRDSTWPSKYRYVLVDEFQDISVGRMQLLQALKDSGVAFFVVGDDWQSIYRFAGSDVSLVHGCGSHLGNVRLRTLTRTFRYADGILDASTRFIKKNPEQSQRPLHSNSSAPDEGITVIASDDPRSGAHSALSEIAGSALDHPQGVLVLGRYTNSKQAVSRDVEFSTVHRAKGREADYVIVLDLKDDRWGFPSQFSDDAVLDLVLPPLHGGALPFAEERRLFYVAMTRARNRVYLVTDRKFPSRFVTELLEQSNDLRHIGRLAPAPLCPRCPSGRLVVSQTGKTLRCTNHPRCVHQAQRCRNCDEGYVVVKKEFEATCTNPDCREPPDVCPWCGLGVIVLRERADKTGTFKGCTEYFSELKCGYTRNTRHRVGDER